MALWVPFLFGAGVGALLGFLLGEFAAWLAAGRWRREARRRARRIASLEAELLATQAQLAPPAQLATSTTTPSTRIAARAAS